MTVYELADKYGIKYSHFPQCPESKTYFYTHHKNGRGWSVLASEEYHTVLLVGAYVIPSNRTMPSYGEIRGAINACRKDVRNNARQFMKALVAEGV